MRTAHGNSERQKKRMLQYQAFTGWRRCLRHFDRIGFFDHTLSAFAVHGRFGPQVKTIGDLYVDGHHTVEDTGIVLGKAFCTGLWRSVRYCTFW